MRGACRHLADALDRCRGIDAPATMARLREDGLACMGKGVDRPCTLWTWGARVLVPARIVVPSMEWLRDAARQPVDRALSRRRCSRQQHQLLLDATAAIRWASPHSRHLAVSSGLRLLLVRGYTTLNTIQDDDLKQPIHSLLEGYRCPRCGVVRARRLFTLTQAWIDTPQPSRPLTITELVEVARTPAAFREVMMLYLETYTARVSDTYTTRRGKTIAIAHFWRFLTESTPR